MSSTEFTDIIPLRVEYDVLKIEVGDKKYKAYSIPFETALGTSESGNTRTTYHYMTNYYIVFHEDRLVYWGYMYELMRAEDTVINDIGRYIQNNYDTVY